MSKVWMCRKCKATDVPLNGRTEPQRWLKCQFGLNVGERHQWEKLTDREYQQLQDRRANERQKQSKKALPLQTKS